MAVRDKEWFKARRPDNKPDDARMMDIYRIPFQKAADRLVDGVVVERGGRKENRRR